MKKFFQKRISILLAILMVFSMFAFAPEMFMKASAANNDTFGQHKVRMRLDVASDEWECDSGKQLKILYRQKRNDTTSLSAVICTTSSNNFNTKDKTYYLGNAGNSAGMDDPSGRDGITVNGFPVGWDFSTMKSNNSCEDAGFTAHIDVWNENTSSWVEVGSGGETVSKKSYFSKKDGIISLTGTTAPSASKIEYDNPGSGEVTVKKSENVSVSGSKAATVYDQYGVVLTTSDLAFRLYDSESGTTAVNSTYATVAKASDKPTVTVKPAAADWVLAGGGTQRSMYVQAYCGSVNSGSDRYEVAVTNYTVNVTYDLNTGTYWGTEDDQSETASETVDYGFYPVEIPTSAYKLGYNFKGIFTATSGGTQVTASTQIKADKTFYAQWEAYDNKVEYYNSDGQLVERYESKYGQVISGVGTPSTPSYPGKTQAIDGTYAFDKWIVWDCPTHPEWVGEDRATIAANTLDLNDDGGTAIKFIATYKLSSGATVKTYTATFKNASGDVLGSTTGAYWTEYTPYNASDKPALAQGAPGSAVTTANGFVLSDYDYTFEGWTTKVPSNGKWGTEADVEYTSADHLRLKEDITFYPCYSKVTKQCAVTKNYYKLVEGNITSATENIEKSLLTELHRMYDLGAADPFSFNYGGFTYTFKGWSETNVNPGTVPASYIAYESGSAMISLEGDVTVWAVYEKSEIKYNAYYYNGSSLIGQYENLSRYSDGVELITYTIADQYDGDVPVKERAVQTGYTFAGWVEDPAKAINPAEEDLVTSYTFGEQSRTFYAAFNTYSFYRVTFINDEGEMLQTSSDYVYGDVISYTEEAPEEDISLIPVVNNKASGVQYQYTFMGWMSSEGAENTLSFEDEAEGTVNYAVAKGEGSNITVTGNRTYTAVFKKELREYKISLYGIGVDLENKDAPAPEPIAVLTLKYGSNILNAVKALYDYGEADEADKNVVAINGTALKVVPYGEETEVNLPYANDIYAYSFYGWTPSINANATVTKNASYVATYRTDNVLYSTHWYTPTACDATEPYAGQGYTEQVITYRYRRAIGTPAKTPSVAAPTAVDNYSWTFLGWYECDENQVIKTDEDGNEIKYTKGTVTDPGDNHNRDFYYVAKFGFTANDYTVNVYDEAGAVVLGSYTGEYGKPVNLGNFKKSYDNDNHYILEGFEDMATTALTPASSDADTTPYTVNGNANLKVKYTAEAHNWEEAAVAHTILPTYEIDGLNTLTCTCGYKKTETVDKFVDSYGPIGRIVINEYSWDADNGPEEAYIGENAIISIISVDRGDKEDVTNVGEGIKSIVYTWSNGESGSTAGVQYEDTAKNFGIPMAEDFEDGMTLTAVITDWTDRTYEITTGELYIDTVKPVIDIEATCEGFMLGVKEERFSRVEVTIDGEAADISAYEVDATAEGYAKAYVAEPVEGETETTLVPEGFYIITAYDKAGNKAEAKFRVTNKHEWNDGKITTKVTCTTDGVKTFTCTVCGDTKTEDIKTEGHKWNGIYDEDGVLTEYTYTVDKAPTCEEAGEKSVYCSVCGEMLEDSTVEIPATGHDYVINEAEATCAAAGYKVTTCKNCDYYEHLSFAQLTHEVDTEAEGADENGWIIGKAATCSAKGSMYQICKLCEEHINVTEIALKAHDFEEVTPEGTYCKAAPIEGATEDTYHLYKCKACGYSFVFNPDAKTHNYALTEEKAATCTADKTYTYTCTKCDDVLEEVERLTSLGGHVWDNGAITKEASCFEEGVKTYTCTNPGCTEKKTEAIAKIDHTWGEGEVTTAATCTTDGEMTYTCTVEGCGATKTEVIDKNENGHGIEDGDWVVTEATCLVDGKKVATCPLCNNEITVVIPATGAHKKADGDEGTLVEATCQHKAGLEYTCEVCHENFVEYDETTEYADHVMGDKVAEKCTPPTCEGEGEDVYKCSVCEEEFAVTVAPAGHNYEVTFTGECEDNGSNQYHEYKCSVCKRVYVDNIALKEHQYGEAKVEVVPATCTEYGTYKLVCEVCGAKSEAKIDRDDPMTGHTAAAPVKENIVAATCTKDGSHDDVIYCAKCEKELKRTKGVVDKALGHDYEVETVAATCYAVGKKTTTCSRCDYVLEEVLPKDESLHVWGEGEETPATCTTDGEMTYTCTVEGCEATKTEVIPATGHTPTEEGGETSDEGDCKHRSVIEYTCDTCGETYTEEGPFGTHVLGDLVKVTTAPTCTAPGSGVYNCDVCGATMPNISIAPTGNHTWDEGKVTSVATCTEDGEMTYTCIACGATRTEEIESFGGHDWVETAKVPASCQAEGMEAYIQCSKCKQYAVKVGEEGEYEYEITDTEPQVIAKKVHTPKVDAEEKLVYEQTVAPTCAKFGKEVNKCSACGEVLATRAVAKVGHTKGDLITTNKPVTCKQDGEYVYKCSVCSETFVVTVEKSDDYHSYGVWSAWKDVVGNEATCTEAGQQERSRKCDFCNAVDTETKEAPALGHDFSVFVEDIITVSEDGKTTTTTPIYKCSRCDETEEGEATSETTCTVSVTVGETEYKIHVISGNQLTEEMILEAVGEINTELTPAQIAAGEDDGVNKVVWTPALPCTVEADMEVSYSLEYVANTYTVIFRNADGLAISTKDYLKGEEVEVPDDLIVAGYKFLGWTDGTTEYASGEKITVSGEGNVEFTPVLDPMSKYTTFTVNFMSDSGATVLHTDVYEVREDGEGETPVAFTAQTKAYNSTLHYTWFGWVTAKGGSELYDFTAKLTYKTDERQVAVNVYAKFNSATHTPDDSVVTQEQACDKYEVTTHTCACGYTWNQNTKNPLGHDYALNGEPELAGNQTIYNYKCSRCDSTYKKVVTTGDVKNGVNITVKDGNGAAVADARVMIYLGNNMLVSKTTDANGVVTFPTLDVEHPENGGLADGTYAIKVEKTGYDTLSGKVLVTNAKGVVSLGAINKIVCHCVCHSSGFFGTIKRFFNNFIRFFNKSYKCCSCGECEVIH